MLAADRERETITLVSQQQMQKLVIPHIINNIKLKSHVTCEYSYILKHRTNTITGCEETQIANIQTQLCGDNKCFRDIDNERTTIIKDERTSLKKSRPSSDGGVGGGVGTIIIVR